MVEGLAGGCGPTQETPGWGGGVADSRKETTLEGIGITLRRRSGVGGGERESVLLAAHTHNVKWDLKVAVSFILRVQMPAHGTQ